jgi:plastocyanin
MVRILCLPAILLAVACSTAPRQEAKNTEQKQSAAYFKVDPATAGSIQGKVAFSGRKPALQRIRMEAEEDCMKAHKAPPVDPTVVVNSNGTLKNVFVYVKAGLEDKTFEPVQTAVNFDQKGCMFEPRVLGLQAGQPLRITNSDTVTHNVHPLPRKNREWNQGQPAGSPPLERTFPVPEIMIPVKCNVHAWMRSYIGVMPHPFFATTGEEGTFDIKGLPPGDYVIEAWHEKYPPQEQKVSLPPSGAITLDFTFKGD